MVLFEAWTDAPPLLVISESGRFRVVLYGGELHGRLI